MKYLALGDSYTIGEAVDRKDSFPYMLTSELKVNSPQIIAKTGWTTTDLLNGISNSKLEHSYDLITLCIGVNNQYQGKSKNQYIQDLEKLFSIINSLSAKKVVSISIPNYGFTPFGRNWQSYISSDLKWYNSTHKDYSYKNNASWLDIESISQNGLLDSNLLAQDSLHPSGKMYQIISSQIIKTIS